MIAAQKLNAALVERGVLSAKVSLYKFLPFNEITNYVLARRIRTRS
jgi:hypothetical protein